MIMDSSQMGDTLSQISASVSGSQVTSLAAQKRLTKRITPSPSPPKSPSPPDSKRRRYNTSPVRPWKSPSPSADTPSLLRHISVIRENPLIPKPQVVPTPYHPYLVDPYAAYHLYKNTPTGMTNPSAPTAPPHWSAYN